MMHEVAMLAASLKSGKLPTAQPRDLQAAVRLIADELAHPVATVYDVRNAAKVLNDQRHFNHTRTLGKAWRDHRPFDASVTKRYAQALIDLFELDTAEALLNDALGKARAPDADAQAASEVPEYLGLLGRIEKQRFVSSGDKDRLVRATDRYLAQLEAAHASDRWFYQGINAIALAAREKREGARPPSRTIAVPDAKDVLARMVELYSQTPRDPWVPATASEACLALDRCDDAELWLFRFIHHGEIEPFYVQSYDRQLREIWEGDPVGDGARCADRLARIMSRHIMRTQAQFTIATAAVPALREALEGAATAEGLEKNFLGEDTFSVANVRDMLTACSSIGCVTNASGARLGTGFLIDGKWLGVDAAGPIFVTNAHVISASVPKAILPENARVTFEVESELAGMPLYYKVGEVLCTSPPARLGTSSDDALDVTIVTLQPMTQSTPHMSSLRAADQLPLIQDKAKAYVVGHPLGGGLQISLHDSVLLDVDDAQRLVHYRTPTDPGSSGSPVFNTEWQVIGLHHGGSGKTPRLRGTGDYEANEAISLLAIREHMARRR
jgi:V8-like Glu-specific endopeptidase